MNFELLAARLRDLHLTVAVAESAAGGLIAAELSRLPGSSAYFRGSVVAYDDQSKTHILGIPEQLFVEHGSVSPQACVAMAEAARRVFGADIGLGETSVAGPGGGTEAKPVGLSFVAIASATQRNTRENRFTGDRDQNRRAAVEAAFELLEQALD